jgi:hypothetical protein
VELLPARQSLNEVPTKQKPLETSRGFCGSWNSRLNQPHPSMPSVSLSDSDRYELNKVFTELIVPQLCINCN